LTNLGFFCFPGQLLVHSTHTRGNTVFFITFVQFLIMATHTHTHTHTPADTLTHTLAATGTRDDASKHNDAHRQRARAHTHTHTSYTHHLCAAALSLHQALWVNRRKDKLVRRKDTIEEKTNWTQTTHTHTHTHTHM